MLRSTACQQHLDLQFLQAFRRHKSSSKLGTWGATGYLMIVASVSIGQGMQAAWLISAGVDLQVFSREQMDPPVHLHLQPESKHRAGPTCRRSKRRLFPGPRFFDRKVRTHRQLAQFFYCFYNSQTCSVGHSCS